MYPFPRSDAILVSRSNKRTIMAVPSRTAILTARNVKGRFWQVNIQTTSPCVAADVDYSVRTEVAEDLCPQVGDRLTQFNHGLLL